MAFLAAKGRCLFISFSQNRKLRGQLRAAFAAAGSQNLAAVHAFGTGQKAVLLRAVNLFGLECSFHASHLLFQGKPQHIVENFIFIHKAYRHGAKESPAK